MDVADMSELEVVISPQKLSFAEFTALVERHQRELFTFLSGLISHSEQARDLLQDTFCDAWRAARRGSAPLVEGGEAEAMRRWLFHTAYCRGIDLLRRRQLLRWVSLDERGEAGDAVLNNLVSSFEDQWIEDEALRAALRTLTPKDAICLQLVLVQGFTAAEAARIIGDSPQAVAKRLPRARRRLLDAYLAENNSTQEGHRA
jgi:RNA polymerase sigma-70 factor (ECF subfamily)